MNKQEKIAEIEHLLHLAVITGGGQEVVDGLESDLLLLRSEK